MNLYCPSHICSSDAYRDHYDEIDWSSDIRTVQRFVCDCCGQITFFPGKCRDCNEPLRLVE